MCFDEYMTSYVFLDEDFCLDKQLNSYFQVEPECDDEGYQHILIQTCCNVPKDENCTNRILDISMQEWLTEDISNVLILSYNQTNELSVTWCENDVTRLEIKGAKVKSFKPISPKIEDKNERIEEDSAIKGVELIVGEYSNALLTIRTHPKVFIDLSII